jgi:SAM-dependent methyltransferase
MDDRHDAFGHMLLDYHEGDRSGREIVERDDGYFDVSSGPDSYFRSYREWPPHEKEAMRYVRGRVLDIGCGAGRHSIYLQNRGFDTTGVDVSPLALRVCRARGLRKTQLLSITQLGPDLGVFDTLLMMCNNFGLFGSPGRARWLLRRFKKLTSENARIIAESNHVYRTTSPFHLEYHRRNRAGGRMAGQLRLRVRHRTYVTPWFDYLLVSQPEMRELIEGTGWHVVRFLESGGAPYIAVMEKD